MDRSRRFPSTFFCYGDVMQGRDKGKCGQRQGHNYVRDQLHSELMPRLRRPGQAGILHLPICPRPPLLLETM